MSYLPINHCDRVAQKDLKYWKLQDMLPDERNPSPGSTFHIKHAFWGYVSGFVDLAHFRDFYVLRPSEWLEIELKYLSRGTDVLDLRVGIVRKSGKEVVASNAQITRPEQSAVIRVIRRSELHKIMHSYKDLGFFVAVDAKNKEERQKEDENKYCK